MKPATIERVRSAAGILLLGVGVLLLKQHLGQTITDLNHLLGNVSSGMFPMVVMDEAQQTWPKGGTDFNHVLQPILQQVFVSVRPVLLVRFGIGLSTGCRREE
jgi:thiol:disulfide interchange protein